MQKKEVQTATEGGVLDAADDDITFRPNKNFIKVITPFLTKTSAKYSGYDICKKANLRTGVVYPLLNELSKKSWLSFEWETCPAEEIKGPRRKLYQITPAGVRNGRKAINTEFPFLLSAMSSETLITN